ncbi:MAG: Bax inhibitor-1/YccA family protein [Candidatus Dojkabacteria bacterium]
MNTTTDNLMQTTGSVFGGFMAQVYGWMVAGLFITFTVAFGVEFLAERNEQFYLTLATLTPFVLIGQLILVLVLGFLGRRMNAFLAGALFLIYALTMGVFFGVIFLGFTTISIVLVFAATTITFLVMAVFGFVTKQDLTSWGRLALFGILGLIIGSIINIAVFFIAPGVAQGIDYVLTYVGIGLFLILIAYDTQRLKKMAASIGENGMGMTGLAIQGALALYLDFINLFIRLLGIMGKRR